MLKLPGKIVHTKEKDDLYHELAIALIAHSQKAIKDRGVFHLALSGGSTPEPFYTDLIIDPRYRGIPWEQTHVWIVDERRVDEHDDKSNIKMIRESLVAHVPIPDEQIHSMHAAADHADDDYEIELRKVFGEADGEVGELRLDFVVLGMGDDCHTASLFPNSGAIDETDRLIVINEGANVTPPDRVTMTFPLLNAARYLAVLVTGKKKFDALERVATLNQLGHQDVHNVPISGIKPELGELVWYVDHPALLGE
ncbi:6-phosphogluconolactonase [Poriferisphaera corsica]|uniref:6-phosphogluconolactonase n=1 Tax=Poriferisphaera corsica TaxID=2528020 RepID=A0A517YVA3_9BACT|nr:6-phosphogluconolactonase [Poriferisphaera corsica]QDU34154.1 6-phosphogluconolactonase [Poriferisphaera corsica]